MNNNNMYGGENNLWMYNASDTSPPSNTTLQPASSPLPDHLDMTQSINFLQNMDLMQRGMFPGSLYSNGNNAAVNNMQLPTLSPQPLQRRDSYNRNLFDYPPTQQHSTQQLQSQSNPQQLFQNQLQESNKPWVLTNPLQQINSQNSSPIQGQNDFSPQRLAGDSYRNKMTDKGNNYSRGDPPMYQHHVQAQSQDNTMKGLMGIVKQPPPPPQSPQIASSPSYQLTDPNLSQDGNKTDMHLQTENKTLRSDQSKSRFIRQQQMAEDRHKKNNINSVFSAGIKHKTNGKVSKVSASVRETRYDNTMSALKKAGLLDITLQTGELLKKNNSLQKDIDMLEEIVKVTKHLMNNE
ncbi:probable serine/threonine-protein kinase tsuA [Clytia hemisphaerica]|uniref:Uncharacterized protein n=1 Tax=Clytia hemisphaerica TaxID=252671 RepID=A0A7M5WW11_9CNID